MFQLFPQTKHVDKLLVSLSLCLVTDFILQYSCLSLKHTETLSVNLRHDSIQPTLRRDTTPRPRSQSLMGLHALRNGTAAPLILQSCALHNEPRSTSQHDVKICNVFCSMHTSTLFGRGNNASSIYTAHNCPRLFFLLNLRIFRRHRAAS